MQTLVPISKVAQRGLYAIVKRSATTLYFGQQQAPITILAKGGGNTLVADLQVHKD